LQTLWKQLANELARTDSYRRSWCHHEPL